MLIINQSNSIINEKKLFLLDVRFKNLCRQFNYYRISHMIFLEDNDKRFMGSLMKRYDLAYAENTKELNLYIPIGVVKDWFNNPLIETKLDDIFLAAAREAMFNY